MRSDELPLALSYHRSEKGLTQKQLADLLNVSDRSIKMWESGSAVPRKGIRIRLAQEFGLPPEYFLQDDEIPGRAASEPRTDDPDRELRDLQLRLQTMLSDAEVPDRVKQDLARAIDQTMNKLWNQEHKRLY